MSPGAVPPGTPADADPETAPPAPVPRPPSARRFGRVFSSLSVRNYRLFFWGYTVSIVGTWTQTLALAFLVLRLTGSGSDLGVVTGARFLPFVLLGPFGGLIADRYDKRRPLHLTQTASAGVAALFALRVWLNAATIPLAVLLSLLLGVLTVVDNPARQSLIAELVPRDILANAVTLNSVAVNLSRVLGAAVGGALVAAVGLGACFAINALSFAAVLAGLAMMRPAEMEPVDRPSRQKGQVRDGLRYVRRTPPPSSCCC